MNNLPNELLPLIFKHLKIRDLMQCRMVCKRFQLFCDEVKLEELVITDNVQNKKAYWFHTIQQFNYADGIDIHTFIMCRPKFRFDQLKRMYFGGSCEDFKLLQLNDFTQLEQLTICSRDRVDRNRVVEISLPNLKVLHERHFSDHYNLELNTPNLGFLKCDSFVFMNIRHPDSIKHLERDFCLCRSVNLFKNVEYLKFDLALLVRDDDFLSGYPKLKTVLCNYDFQIDDEDDYYREMTAYNIESIKALRQLVILRPELTIYFQSVKLENTEKIDEYDPQKHLAFQINNYDSLCDDIYDNDLMFDYSELMRLVNGTLPDDFYKKYFNIESVLVSEIVESEEHFVEFLKRLEYLKLLCLTSGTFNQEFYDRLPEMNQISFLHLGRGIKPITNYDFLFKMNRLSKLGMKGHDPTEFFDLTLALFSRLKYFCSIYFIFNNEELRVTRDTSSDKYSVLRIKQNPKAKKSKTIAKKEKIHFDELVGFLTTYKNNIKKSKQN